jgi:hypothetical protein
MKQSTGATVQALLVASNSMCVQDDESREAKSHVWERERHASKYPVHLLVPLARSVFRSWKSRPMRPDNRSPQGLSRSVGAGV